MADRTISLSVVTPSKLVYEGEVRSFKAPGSEGYFQVLAGHVPMLSSLRAGIMTIQDQEAIRIYAISGGFAEVLRQQATVLAESVEQGTEIDVERARQAAERARRRLESKEPGIDLSRAQAALDRALNRVKAAEMAVR
ncbi:MAG: F0F1 ATP synthase subunit epsilon [candidate division Zixibacteria bacterium]|nr:F0F1 ATP synthase subunit epsilon [candidate division Zixibacteria bacterium]